MPTMKAVQIHSFGDASVLRYEDAPLPTPAAAEVRIRVHAAGVNPVDWKTRQGQGVAGNMPSGPIILGWDVSGVVESVGAEVTQLEPGAAVYGMINFPQHGGGYAEYAVAPAAHLAHKPSTLDHQQAAAVPLAALTAWQALFEVAQLQAGQRVLIHAAAGGVGHLAVQLAKWRGAYVIGTASARNAGLLRELGVDAAIDYTSAPFEQAVQDVDVVLDTVGGTTQARSFAVLRPGGQLVSIVGQPAAELAQQHNVRAHWWLVEPNSAQLAQIATLIDQGQLRPLVDTVLPLAEASEAHRLSESRHARGKIVLQVR